MSIEQIFDFMNKSNLTIVGYQFQDERIKDEFISKLPHIEIFEFDSSFSVMSLLKRMLIIYNFTLENLKDYKYICSYENNK
jgi:hypothetical protein